MAENKTILRNAYEIWIIIISMAGFVPKNATIARILIMLLSLIYAIYLTIYQSNNLSFALFYFLISEISYVGFLTSVLSENGLRKWLIQKLGNENKAYLTYEGILGFLFFHNLISIGYIASSSRGNLFSFIEKEILLIPVVIMFLSGFTIKILAAKAVSIEIYYLKDMFLGKKISEFIVTGPYKYFRNPMYGLGQLQAYATAIWYGSEIGFMAAILNQTLVFTFYYMVERKFIRRVYLNNQ